MNRGIAGGPVFLRNRVLDRDRKGCVGREAARVPYLHAVGAGVGRGHDLGQGGRQRDDGLGQAAGRGDGAHADAEAGLCADTAPREMQRPRECAASDGLVRTHRRKIPRIKRNENLNF